MPKKGNHIQKKIRGFINLPFFYEKEFVLPFLLGLALAVITFSIITHFVAFLADSILLLALAISLQGIITLYLMLYAWEDTAKIIGNRTTRKFSSKKYGITALVPARHEEKVIADTIQAINKINYPDRYKETLIICRTDDKETIRKVKQIIKQIGKKNIKLVTFNSLPINKPHSLNIGLKKASKDIIVVFDAEDQPHKDIYNTVNTVLQREHADVIQSGVQLMNFRSSWYSLFNVLEYYFWFKSSLHFFAKMGSVPLGGNSVFFRKKLLEQINGWDENCLTEDADIGFRLSAAGARVKITYQEGNATQEETPSTLDSFIKQRTRWNQGFIQILLKGEWLKLKKKRQKLLTGYILLVPEIQSFLFLMIPLSFVMSFTLKLSVLVTLFTILPLLLLILQLMMLNVGLFEFTKSYKFRYPMHIAFVTILFFYPYQIILGLSAIRAILRLLQGNISWEKTLHTNAHREQTELSPIAPAIIS